LDWHEIQAVKNENDRRIEEYRKMQAAINKG
jgi:hypothetical protein